jgi:Tol biopolymer transport system component
MASPAGEGSHEFDLPFTDKDLEIFVLRVTRMGTRASVRRVEAPEMQYVKQFGGRLFESVFSGAVRDCLIGSINETEDQNVGLRLRLRLGAGSGLVNVPWECMYDAAFDNFIGLAEATPLVRYIDLPSPARPLLVEPPMRILMMVASPRGLPSLDADREWANLQGALRPMLEREQVVLERLNVATLAALQGRLQSRDYHVFHFIGHGGFDEKQQDGVLMLEDDAGGARPAGAAAISTLLRKRSLRLVILNACEGARATESDPFAGTAQTLVRTGIPAVIAMQFEITDEAAIMFSREFYGALTAGLSVDAAVCEARKAIFTQVNAVEWATPVLYMRSRDGQIFDLRTTKEESPPPPPPPPDANEPEIDEPENVVDVSEDEKHVEEPEPEPVGVVPEPPKPVRPAVSVAAALERVSSDPHGPQRYRLLLDNAGREKTEVRVSVQDPDDALVLDLSADTVVLSPGQETTTEVVVRPRGRTWNAQPHEHPFNIVIEPTGDSPKVVRGVLVLPPTVTRGRVAFAVLGVVAVIGLIGFALFRPHSAPTAGSGGGGGGTSAGGSGTVPIPGRIAYVRGSDIFVTKPSGGVGRNLTADLGGDSKQPGWSPDGQWLAFSNDEDGTPRIVEVRLSDGFERKLPSPSSPANDTAPAWSPDGIRIAFLSGPTADQHLYLTNADGSGSPTMIDGGSDGKPSWSPDGNSIVFRRSGGGPEGLFTLSIAGGQATQLTDNAGDRSPAWFPSELIVFHSSRPGACCALFTVDPATGQVRDLHLVGAEPSWSPDRKFITFHRVGEVWIADANGGNAHQIVDAGGGNPDPAW